MTPVKIVFSPLVFLVLAAHAADWPQWRGPGRNGVSAETGLPDQWTPGPGGSGNVLWRQNTNAGRETETAAGSLDAGSPVVVGSGASGRVFFLHSVQSLVSSRIVCLRASDGAFQWDYLTTVYGGNGFQVCTNHQGASTPYVNVQSQRVYYGTKEGRLLCLDFSGQMVWRRLSQVNTPGEDPTAFGVEIHNCGNATPVSAGGRVVFPLIPGYTTVAGRPALVGLDPATGGTGWIQNFYPYAAPRGQIIHGSHGAPIVAATPDGVERIFMQFGDGSVRSVRASDGQLLWTHADNSGIQSAHGGVGQEGVAAPAYNPPGAAETTSTGAVYVAAGIDPSYTRPGQGALWKLNAQTGAEVWVYRHANLGNTVGSAAITGNRLYIGDNSGYLHCVNLQTGQPFWVRQMGGGIWASATLGEGKVYLGTQGGDFFILKDSSAFAMLDSSDVGSPIAASAAIANGVLYVKSTRYIFAVSKGPVGGELRIGKVPGGNLMTVAPNPSGGAVSVLISGDPSKAELTIVDPRGQTVRRFSRGSIVSGSCGVLLPPGTYFFHLKAGSQTVVKKVAIGN